MAACGGVFWVENSLGAGNRETGKHEGRSGRSHHQQTPKGKFHGGPPHWGQGESLAVCGRWSSANLGLFFHLEHAPSWPTGNFSYQRRRGQSCCVRDRKSTRLNSSHRCISYAVFCLKKKKYT